MSELEDKEIEKNINNCLKASSEYSSILSSICRKIAFAEGALYWLLYKGFNFPSMYILIGYILLLLYFLTDLSQYLLGYKVYKKKAKDNQKYLKKGIKDEELHSVSDDDLHWVYQTMHIKIIFILISSVIIVSIFATLLLSGSK